MQPHKKSVKLFVDCLFLCSGSGKPLLPNKRKQFTPKDVNLCNLFSVEIYQISNTREQKLQAQLLLINRLYFYSSIFSIVVIRYKLI